MHTTNTRRGRWSSRPFYTTVLLLTILTAYSYLSRTRFGGSGLYEEVSLLKRKEAPECREVHTAQDQCAFVEQYCKDDDAGLLPYLHLYYCTLGEVQPIAFLILITWLGLLFTTIGIAASDFFSVNLSTIATILGLSESLAGVTFLAFGNGSPDVFSTFAAMGSNSASMAVGELIGAASFITGVVAGSMALVREFRVDRRTYVRDILFFILAVAFTMYFLADGELRFWECCVMIGYYVVYVCFVVGWHWYTTRRRQRQRRDGESRSHYYGLAGHTGDELAGEPYRDDPDEHRDEDSTRHPSMGSRAGSDLSALESGPRIELNSQATDLGSELDDQDTEEARKITAATEASRSMRVLRGGHQIHRRNTHASIRPSLVGVLEFRSALAQLQRDSNLQLPMIPTRSYSEDHAVRGRSGSSSTVPHQTPMDSGGLTPTNTNMGRGRAMSHGNAPISTSMPPDLLGDMEFEEHSQLHIARPQAERPKPSGSISSYVVDGKLAPPPIGPLPTSSDSSAHDDALDPASPRLQLLIPSRPSSRSDRSSPVSPFPRYTDSPTLLTPNPHVDNEEHPAPLPVVVRHDGSFIDLREADEPLRPVRWWPYALLPPPQILLATLFPTLQGWREKTYWDKAVSAISVPSVFLLVVTLPVVESETSEEAAGTADAIAHSSYGEIGHLAPPISIQPGEIQPEDEWERYQRSRRNSTRSSLRRAGLDAEDTIVEVASQSLPGVAKPMSETQSVSIGSSERQQWNRWLVSLQLFLGPIFAVIILWANMAEDFEHPGRELVRMLLYTLVGSLMLLASLLLLTSEDMRPKYHFLFCFLGFIISIAWISTIAGEVVGVLKTFGVVLGISEALLGLTIFAAGNSVGDLVADITVARLGYPVMALSACFGGPMLNILLGIGIGGVLMMVKDANRHRRKHPDRQYDYGPYRIQIGGTLMVSSITLLIILVCLLVYVPMNKWMLSRKIGWTLIALWTASTIINVVVEITGVWGEIA